jgi:glycerate kinase
VHVLVAPNAFKHSLAAEAAADAIASGLRESRLDCRVDCFPVGDGGDGTGELLIARKQGLTISVPSHDALGRPISARLGLIDGGRVAVIELAEASGIRRLAAQELNPLRATTFGTGELIRAALDRGARRILLAVGGSATVDGGAGILAALDARFHGVLGGTANPAPEGLLELSAVDLSSIDPRLRETEIFVLCDVDNPLLGPRGAARVFGPQKGATPKTVEQLERALENWRDRLRQATGVDVTQVVRGGAAGGVAAGLHAALGAKLVNGIEYFLNEAGFDAALARTELVITGEGSIDEQTLGGKAPYGVAMRAKARGIPVIGLAGQVPREPSTQLQQCFDALLPIAKERLELADALRLTSVHLRQTAREIGDQWPGCLGKYGC